MSQVLQVPFSHVRKIIHLADVHIRLFKRHDEYRKCFETLYGDLRAQDLTETVIVVAGDIVHSKTDLSPEMVDLATSFLKNLADIAPTIVIAGNHDMNMANRNRLDALTPICENINNPNLHYLKHSGVYQCGDVSFALHSLIGEQVEWPSPEDCDDLTTKIALYHGPLFNATTDVGYTVTSRHVEDKTFDGYDIVLLGDIHKHQVLGTNPVIVYPGSLIQQNHGEALKGHGWCEWDVPRRTFQFHELYNEYGYYTIRVDNGVIPSYDDIPKRVRLRIFAGELDQAEIKKLIAAVRAKVTVEEVSVTNFAGAKASNATVDTSHFLDIHDVQYQNKMIVDYLREAMPNTSDETLDRITRLNAELNDRITSDDPTRKIMWRPKRLAFSNLFSYGEGNVIDFTQLSGVHGIFAANASGKTSIADAICFALYDRTPRTIRAVNIINSRAEECACELTFEIDGDTYVISRTGKRNRKGEVKMECDFYRLNADGSKVSLNGEDRRYTNQQIRNYVGDYEDFVLTTFSTQSQQSLFVDRGQSDRKDLLSQFMGLTVFDKLHTLANDESKALAGELRRFKNDDFTQELVDTQSAIEDAQAELVQKEAEFEVVNEQLNTLTEEIQELYAKQIPIKATRTNLSDLEQERDQLAHSIARQEEEISATEGEITKTAALLAKAKVKLEGEYAGVPERHAAYTEVDDKLTTASSERMRVKWSIEGHEKYLVEFNKYEYDPNCEFCVKNGRSTINTKADHERMVARDRELYQKYDEECAALEQELASFGDIKELYEKYKTGVEFVRKHELVVSQLETKQEKQRVRLGMLQQKHADVLRDIELVKEQQDAIKENGRLTLEIADRESKKNNLKLLFKTHQTDIKRVESTISVLRDRKQTILDRIEQAKDLESQYEAYEAYLTAVCRDGLPYKMIAEVLPNVEAAVNNLLSQMVDFSLRFEMDGKNVNMKIVYDDARVWPLELASGMEKFISGLAIRVALMSVSSLPKSNFLIIDEGLGALDADNLASIFMLFDMLRSQFELILLISHVDSARDVADGLIEIRRQDGFSYVTV